MQQILVTKLTVNAPVETSGFPDPNGTLPQFTQLWFCNALTLLRASCIVPDALPKCQNEQTKPAPMVREQACLAERDIIEREF